jgi:5-methylcytosine-specific restriction endonuclease McrA
MQDEGYKRCPGCGETKPLGEYTVNRSVPSGIEWRCKTCTRAKARAYRAANRQNFKVYSLRHRDKIKQADPPRYSVRTRLARTRLPVPSDAVEYGAVLLGDPCTYCGGVAGEIDHIVPVTKGGTNDWDNLAPICRGCNKRKSTATPLDALMRIHLADLHENWSERFAA